LIVGRAQLRQQRLIDSQADAASPRGWRLIKLMFITTCVRDEAARIDPCPVNES